MALIDRICIDEILLGATRSSHFCGPQSTTEAIECEHTKKLLTKHGIDTSEWKAHSTRGAGVLLYKNLGLTSEEVCEIGK